MKLVEAKSIVEVAYPELISEKNTSRKNAWVCKQLFDRNLEHLDGYIKEMHELNAEFKRLMGEFNLAEAKNNEFLMGAFYNKLMYVDVDFEAVSKIADKRQREGAALLMLLEYYVDRSEKDRMSSKKKVKVKLNPRRKRRK